MGAGKLKGVTVTLIRRDFALDGFNYPTWTETREEVANVLIGEPTQSESENSAGVKEARAQYTLAIPKGDTHDWQDCVVEFWGKRWRQTGQPVQGIENLIPLSWNQKITVEEVL